MHIETIMPLPGHWRTPTIQSHRVQFSSCTIGFRGALDVTKARAEARCCPGTTCAALNASVLNDNPNALCAPGYGGKLCLTCAPDYYKVGKEQNCVQCPGGGPDIGLAFLFVCAFCVLVFFGTFLYLFMMDSLKTTKAEKKASAVFGQLKILVSFCQIMSALPRVMSGVPFPSGFLAVAVPFKMFNLDFLGMLPISVCRLAVGFHESLIVHVCLLPLLGSAIIAAYALVNVIKKPISAICWARRRAEIAKMLILATLFLYPGLATRLFTLFNCTSLDDVDGGKLFLEVDWSIECGVGKHAAMTVLGVAFMLLYIVGIPLLVLVLLFRNRRALHDASHPQHDHVVFEFGGLTSQYEKRYYWFEVPSMLHKCLMTGALVVIGKNSTVQPLVAVLFQLIFLLVVLKLSPFLSDDDDLSSFVGSLAICLATLGSMVLITEGSPIGGRSFDEAFLSTFFVSLMIGTFVFQVLMTVLSTECGANVRERVWQMCTSGERRVENGTTKVVPVNEGSDRNGFLTWGADE
jgi:hypothetical protein